jgi:hypothetical protein
MQIIAKTVNITVGKLFEGWKDDTRQIPTRSRFGVVVFVRLYNNGLTAPDLGAGMPESCEV